MNTELNLWLLTYGSCPANTGGSICPSARWEGTTRCVVLEHSCSDLLTAKSEQKLLLWKQQWGVLQSCTVLRLATPHQVTVHKSGSIYVFSTYRSENGNDVSFFGFPSTPVSFNPLTLLISLAACSFLTNETSFLSVSNQFFIPIAGLKMLQVSAWITRRQKTSQISCLFTVGLISSPLASKTH